MKRKFIQLLISVTFTVFFLSAEAQNQVKRPDGTLLSSVIKKEIADKQIKSPKDNVYNIDSYCIPVGACEWENGITDFAFAGIENYNSGCSDNGYGDFTDMMAEIEIGQTYTATLVTGYYYNFTSIWIDFDKDFEFEEWERVLTDFPMPDAGIVAEVDIVIPGNAIPGITTMRVGINWNSPSSPDPCAQLQYGEWEDYTVNIPGNSINYDAMTRSIVIDSLIPYGEYTPHATVQNMGVETISFPVTMVVNGTDYSSTVQVSDLEIGGVTQLEFDTWDLPVGDYTVEVCTGLSGDEIPENNCMTKEITTQGYDVGVETINMLPVMVTGDVIPKATIINYGFEMVSFPVTMAIENGVYSSTIDIIDLPGRDTIMVEFDVWEALSGNYVLEAETDLSSDVNPSNNSFQKEVYILDEAPVKNVVGEEGTGTWCGWCIRGIVYMDSMQLKYPENWIGIAVHVTDPMQDDDYSAGMDDYFPGYPTAVVNRGESINPVNLEQYFHQEMERVSPASIQIENKQYNTATRELTFTVSSEFLVPVSDHRFSAVLIENGVTGTGSGWAQSNYYSGGANGPMGGYEDLPNPIPAADMVYDHVGRRVIDEFAGVEGSLPANINAGETHSYEFTTILSEDWDENNIEIIGVLLDHNTGRIENGATSHLITSISDIINDQSFTLYPNPSRDKVSIETEENLERVQLFNISGQLVFEQRVSGNKTEISTSEFDSGIYFVKVFSQNNVITKKLVVE